MTAFLIMLAMLIATALQAGLPTWRWLGGLRLEFLPAIVAYGALTLRRNGAITLAVTAGFIQDGLSAGPFGVTAIVYGTAALLVDVLRESVDRDLPPVQMAAGALIATSSAVVACCFVGISLGAVLKISLLGVLSAVATPFVFLFMDYLRYTWRTTSS